MKQLKKSLPLFIFLLLILIFFGKKIIPHQGSFICGIDIEFFSVWINRFIREEFLAGRIPLWNPYNCCGSPLAPHWTFYPATLLYVLFPLPFAFNLDTLLHLCLAAMGMYCFVRFIKGSFFSGLCAGIVYGLGGYFIDQINAGHQIYYLYANSLLPWLFFFVEKSFHERRLRNLSFSGIVLGLQILSGDIQNSYYAAMFISIFYFLRVAFHAAPEEKTEKPFRKISAFLILPIVSFGIGAVQILPSIELLTQSLRSEKTFKFATSFSFPPQNFFTFLVPKNAGVINTANWEFTGYIGILGLILAIIGLVFSKNRQMTRIMAIILIIAATVMLGRYTPVYQLFYNYIPGIANFRFPCRSIIMMVFCLSVLAGLGASHIDSSRLTRNFFLVLSGLGFILGGVLLWGAKTFCIPLLSSSFLLAGGLLVSAFISLLLFPFFRSMKIAHIIVIGILFLDLYLCFAHIVPVKNIQNILQKNSIETFLEKKAPISRIMLPVLFPDKNTGSGVGGVRAMGHRYFDANGYMMVLIKDYVTFIMQMAGLPAKPKKTHWLDNPELFNHDRVFTSRILNIKYALIPGNKKWQMLESNDVFPRACIVHDVIFLPDMASQLDYLQDPQFDPRTKVLLLTDDKEKARSNVSINVNGDNTGPNGRKSAAHIVEYLPNRIELHTDSSQDGFLILSEIFYPGWMAYVDGKKVPVFRADYLLRAVPLTEGRHHVIFVYRPISFIAGGGITMVTFLLILFGNWYQLKRKTLISREG